MNPVTLPVATIDNLMHSLGISEEELLADLLYPDGHQPVDARGPEPSRKAIR